MKRQNGFTLIEIMVTVGIIGLLAVLASVTMSKARNSSLQKQTETELRFLSAAILQMAWDTGRWPNQAIRTTPGSTEVWDLSPGSCGLLSNDGSYENWKGPYYEGDFHDAWWSAKEDHRVYFFDPDYLIDGVNHVVVGSFGPNGEGRNQYDSDDIYILLDD